MKPSGYTGIVAAASFFLLAGCVSTSFRAGRDVKTPTLPPVSAATVRVLKVPPPSGSFHLLGEIEAHLMGFPSDETVLRKAREKAASIGADAIVFSSTMERHRNDVGDLPGTGWTQVVSFTFTAIRLLPEDSSQRRP